MADLLKRNWLILLALLGAALVLAFGLDSVVGALGALGAAVGLGGKAYSKTSVASAPQAGPAVPTPNATPASGRPSAEELLERLERIRARKRSTP
ncbi:MAG: hypothetical protein P1V51_19995 [Deltaproteobacteria bacterium]|nr:hypothetical protein [Deltaproteobacteria bacterium]